MEIIFKPVVTEKMTANTEKSNRFGFLVNGNANKIQVKEAIEKLYNVTVTDVNTMNYSGKKKSRNTKSGVVSGVTNSFKKAIVSVKQGDTIDFYSNI